jgi:hypothetical protein
VAAALLRHLLCEVTTAAADLRRRGEGAEQQLRCPISRSSAAPTPAPDGMIVPPSTLLPVVRSSAAPSSSLLLSHSRTRRVVGRPV